MKIGITGINGKMGKVVANAAINHPLIEIALAFAREENKLDNQDLGLFLGHKKLGVNITSDLDKLFLESDIVIDFSNIELSINAAIKAAETGKILICGTTGFNEEQKQKLAFCARKTVIIWSSNMSIGVNLLINLTQKIANLLDNYDAEIFEMHHNAKIDSPSGTALLLGEAVAKGRNLNFSQVVKKSREGMVGKRSKEEIGICSLRGGDIIGDHSVIFAGLGERIEIAHKAQNREIYALGAIKAAIWAEKKMPGLYSMLDVVEI
jgi:4-hydroxy-tetrahydrodipicolinate reductase